MKKLLIMKQKITSIFTLFIVLSLITGCSKDETTVTETTKTAEISVLYTAKGLEVAHGGPYKVGTVTKPDQVTNVFIYGIGSLPEYDNDGDYWYYDVDNNGRIKFYAKAKNGYHWNQDFTENAEITYRTRN